MTQVNEDDQATRDQVGRGPSERTADLGEPACSPAPGGAPERRPGARPLGPPAGRAGRARAPFRNDARRARRSREGAATVDDARHHGTGGAGPGHASTARDRPAPGGADRDRLWPASGPAVAQAPRGVAGEAVARADSAGAVG